MILLDTCALLWLVDKQENLSPVAKQKIKQHAPHIYVSSISSLEIALKYKKKLLKLPAVPEKWFSEVLKLHGIIEIPIDHCIATTSAGLPDHHNDPFDRLIIATAITNKLSIITCDKHIACYKEVKIIW